MRYSDWVKRRRAGQNAAGRVPFLDAGTGRLVRIPASELPAGAVEARVQGVEGPVWVPADRLEPGEIRHPPFGPEVRASIRRIHETFAEPHPLSFEEWEDGFRRDATPEREIALWLRAADVYTAFSRQEPSAERRWDRFRCIAACLTTGPDTVWRVFQPETLSRSEAEAVVERFFGRSN